MSNGMDRWRTAFYVALLVLGSGLGACAWLWWDARKALARMSGTTEVAHAPSQARDPLPDAVERRMNEADERLESAEERLRACEARLAQTGRQRDDAEAKWKTSQEALQGERERRSRAEDELARAKRAADEATRGHATGNEELQRKLAQAIARLQVDSNEWRQERSRLEGETKELAGELLRERKLAKSASEEAARARGRAAQVQEQLGWNTRFVLHNLAEPAFLEWAVVVRRTPTGAIQVQNWSFAEHNDGWDIGRNQRKSLGEGIFAILYIRQSRQSDNAYAYWHSMDGHPAESVIRLEQHYFQHRR